MVTIRDVAQEAGVAPSTVSYVLNDTKPVTAETREKVLDAVKKLNYMPNSIARSLKTKTTSTIGLIIPDISNPFFSEVTKGIEDVASKYKYGVFICNTYENQEKEEDYLRTLIQKGVDGLIFVGTENTENNLIEKFREPVVIIDRKAKKNIDNYGSVFVNNEKSALEATNYLLGKGNEEIILLSGPLNISTYKERLEGYKKALANKNIQYNEKLVYEILRNHISIEGGYAQMKKIIQENELKKSIFATNDLIAIGAIKALQEEGFKIPQDINIVGFDDIYPSSLITPALTTVAQPKYEIGVEAMKMLYKLMNNKSTVKRNIVLDTKFVIRESA